MKRRRKRTTRHKVRLLHWLYLIIFCGFGWVLLFGDYGVVRIVSSYRLEDKIRKDILELKVQKELLLVRCERLKNDKLMIETLAREKLGMVKPGEKCYRLVD